jgi:RNAse (barnase) inhibitor barstar
VLIAIGRAFGFPEWYGANLDALYDCLTDLPADRAAEGCVVVLLRLPYNEGFDVEQRDALLDVFRDAAEAYADDGIAMRVFYSS